MLNPRQRQVINQANQHYEAGRLQLAQELCQSLFKGKRGPLEAWHLLGLIAMRREQTDLAIQCFQQCTKERPNDPQFPYLAGKMYAMSSRGEEAMPRYDWALSLDPKYIPAITWKAALLERQGKTQEARELIEPHINIDNPDAPPADPEMGHILARIEHAEKNDQTCVEICKREIDRPNQTKRLRQLLSFLMGRTYHRMKRYDEAFEAFELANSFQAEKFRFDAYERWLLDALEMFTGDQASNIPTASTGGESMVMIAGMPRSGTTLIETIIDAHPKAKGIGETADLDRVVVRLPLTLQVQEPYPQVVRNLDQPTANRLAAELDKTFASRAPGAELVINKHLQNWLQVGVMAKLMPRSRVVWIHRDPRDNCLGIYMQHFNPTTIGYAVDLESVARVHKLHMRIMRAWIERLDYPILEVPYESLVDDPEPWTRKIIEFCGLEWDDACLRFHESGRVALTHSYEQVRQPIYKGAIGRWKHYEKHLAPMLKELDRQG